MRIPGGESSGNDGPVTSRRWVVLVILAALMLLVAACEPEEDTDASTADNGNDTEEVQENRTDNDTQDEDQSDAAEGGDEEGSDGADEYAVGDAIEAGGFVVTVNEVQRIEGDEFMQPEKGNTFLIVDLTIENHSDETKSVSSLLQTDVRDSTGQRYDMSITAVTAAGGSTPDGEIAAGDRLRGQLGYEVPLDASGLVFHFDPGVFGIGNQIRVSLD